MKEQRFSSHSPGAVRERLRPKTAMLFARKGAIVGDHEKVGRGRRKDYFRNLSGSQVRRIAVFTLKQEFFGKDAL